MSQKIKELQAQLEAGQAAIREELSPSGGNGSDDAAQNDTAVAVDMRSSARTALDAEGEEMAERKSLLRRKQQQQEAETSRLSFSKIAAVVGVCVVVCLLLLLLLFSHDSRQLESTKPMTVAELRKKRPENPCPDSWWIPEKCKGEKRVKSRRVWSECQKLFDDYEYTVKFLKECHIPIQEGKMPKATTKQRAKSG